MQDRTFILSILPLLLSLPPPLLVYIARQFLPGRIIYLVRHPNAH